MPIFQKNLKNKRNGFILLELNQLSFQDKEVNYQYSK